MRIEIELDEKVVYDYYNISEAIWNSLGDIQKRYFISRYLENIEATFVEKIEEENSDIIPKDFISFSDAIDKEKLDCQLRKVNIDLNKIPDFFIENFPVRVETDKEEINLQNRK